MISVPRRRDSSKRSADSPPLCLLLSLCILLLLLFSLHLHSFSSILMTISAKLHPLFVVYDLVAQSVTGPIITFPSEAVAIRSFSDAVLGSNSVLATHPNDYHFLQVGVIDMTTGKVIPLEEHRLVITPATILELANRDRSILDPAQLEVLNG